MFNRYVYFLTKWTKAAERFTLKNEEVLCLTVSYYGLRFATEIKIHTGYIKIIINDAF